MRAVFMRKEPEIDTKEFQVEKVITLPSEQYAYFTQHLMKEHDGLSTLFQTNFFRLFFRYCTGV